MKFQRQADPIEEFEGHCSIAQIAVFRIGRLVLGRQCPSENRCRSVGISVALEYACACRNQLCLGYFVNRTLSRIALNVLSYFS